MRVGGTIDLRLIGCGEGFADNLLWHLDRADSWDGSLDAKTTRKTTGRGAVVYLCDTGVMRNHDEFSRAAGSVVVGAIAVNGIGKDCPAGQDPSLDPCFTSDTTLSIFTHGTATASMVAGRNTGIAPDATIVSVYMETVGQNIDSWIRTFDAIIQHAWNPTRPQFKTGIISMSFTPNLASARDPKFPAFEKKMRDMIAGVDSGGNPDPAGKRFLFVTVAGNHVDGPGDQCDANMNTNLYPAVLGASIDGLITVDAIDILAPAASLLVASISARDHYRSGRGLPYPGNSGTSYSAPYVSGIAALLLEKNPDLTPIDLERLIKTNASRTANAGEATAGGRVAVFDWIVPVTGRRAGRR